MKYCKYISRDILRSLFELHCHTHTQYQGNSLTVHFVYWKPIYAYIYYKQDPIPKRKTLLSISIKQILFQNLITYWFQIKKDTGKTQKIEHYTFNIIHTQCACVLPWVRLTLGSDLILLRVCFALLLFQLDLRLNSDNGGDISTYVTNGEWDLIGKN